MTQVLERILLVDDDAVTNLLHQRRIARAGLARHVDVATDGRAALDYLEERAAAGAALPDLVLLDINMPRMNGFEFLEACALMPESLRARLRVVMVSTSMLRRDRARAEASPMVAGYETKPLEDADFMRIVCQSASRG